MSEHPSDGRLRDFLDDRLAAEDVERVERHIEACTRCQRALEDVEPRVALPIEVEDAGWDERRMRRAVRRALLRTAFDVLSIVLVVLLVGTAVGAFVISPLVVQRGDRVERAEMAAQDLPMLLTPGAVLRSSGSGAGLASHRHETMFVRYVGGEARELGTFEARTGVLGWRPDPPGGLVGKLGEAAGAARPFAADRLPEGTVASVQVNFRDGIELAAADALAAGHEEVSLQWVGFRVGAISPATVGRPWDEGYDIGYSACSRPTPTRARQGPVTRLPGSAHALEQARRATANLAGSGDIRRHLQETGSPVLAQIDVVADWLADNEPRVASAVLTGPTEDLAAIIAAAGPNDAHQLGVDFYNGPGSCA